MSLPRERDTPHKPAARQHRMRWFVALIALLASALAAAAQPAVLQIDLHDTLQTERAYVFKRAIERANAEHFTAVLVDLSTPGGTASDTDEMVKHMRESGVPIIVWVGASQTRVTGEGLRLLAEADIALMHPETYLTPLWTELPHGLSQAVRSADSQRLAVDLRASTASHGRSNAAVDELSYGIHWFTAAEALQAGFVDGLASRPADVLRFADGRTVRRNGQAVVLGLSGARIVRAGTKPQEVLLLSLMNPDLTVLLLTLGLLLIYLEVNTPGTVVPGTAGVLLVLLRRLRCTCCRSAGGVCCCVLSRWCCCCWRRGFPRTACWPPVASCALWAAWASWSTGRCRSCRWRGERPSAPAWALAA